ncbi:MAG: phage terminase large subunit family protein [Armatimonadia bacterium]
MSRLVMPHHAPAPSLRKVAPRRAAKVDLSGGAFRGTTSQFVERFLTVDGKPFSFARREYLRPIYDRAYPESQRIILKTGRQVEKSTSLATKMLALCAQIPFFRSIYVSPSQMQTRQFSTDRVAANAMRSPHLRKLFKGPGASNQVFDKKLVNGAAMYFRYAFLTPDRCRGISGDELNIDEIQDILVDNIPVIRECLSHSEFKLETYSGTPKTSSNAIEFYWEKSTQNTWMVKCRRCGYYSKLDMSVIGDKFMMCARCHRPIYAIDGQWIRMNSRGTWEGFHVPQLMVSWLPYRELLQKLHDYSTAKFHNEVLGLAYDSGVKPLTEAIMRAACTGGELLQDPSEYVRGFPVFSGLDWGSGEPNDDGECSFTVLALGAMFKPGRLTIFRMKRYTGPEADLQTITTRIGQEFGRFGMVLTVGDWGYGHALNGQLRDSWGVEHVMESEYVTQNIPVKYDPASWRLKVDRTQTMSQFIRAIKRGEVEFFDWEQFATFGQDFLNIDAEHNEKRNKIVYSHRPDAPDDSFHAALYCWLAWKAYYKQLAGMP